MAARSIRRTEQRVEGDANLPTFVRFHATAYMAVANAMKGGAATKLKDGRVHMA